ncbi:Ras-related protein Rab-11A [Frankliniella fusca]|uniref:Ras-related protein Rab-11A n=1 Tax=Frankliniella fusca TaxID=407009 RepID=A0AAE1HIB7_9NEOP|nr:Ras-related protein Rab-11A [Frankliniella fusca]
MFFSFRRTVLCPFLTSKGSRAPFNQLSKLTSFNQNNLIKLKCDQQCSMQLSFKIFYQFAMRTLQSMYKVIFNLFVKSVFYVLWIGIQAEENVIMYCIDVDIEAVEYLERFLTNK